MINWLPDDLPGGTVAFGALALIALSNLVLVTLLLVMVWRGSSARSLARRTTRKLLVAQRRAKGLQYALNVTVNQYHSLRRKHDRRRAAAAGERTPPLVKLDGGRPRFIAPPPLPALELAGEDPQSWADSGIRTALLRDPTQTQPILVDEDLLRQTRPPR